MNEFLKEIIKGTDIEIYEPSIETELATFVDTIVKASKEDYLGKPFIKIINKKIYLYVHDMPSGDDNPNENYHLYSKFNSVSYDAIKKAEEYRENLKYKNVFEILKNIFYRPIPKLIRFVFNDDISITIWLEEQNMFVYRCESKEEYDLLKEVLL